MTPAICGVVSECGPNLEPLACGYPKGHDGAHAWATLPTFPPPKPEPEDESGDYWRAAMGEGDAP